MSNITKLIIAVIAIAILVFAFSKIRTSGIENIEAGYVSCETTAGLCADIQKSEGESYNIPPEQIHDSGLTAEDLPTITDPVFVSAAAADAFLADDVAGIAVEVNGEHRFYSYQILNWHHIVQDEFNGRNLLVTSCPLCQSGIVYQNSTNDQFEVDGRIYQNNFLLKDQNSESLWSQILGIAVSGDRLGETLEQYPSARMTWSTWFELHPNGTALSTETGFERDYTAHPLGGYDTSDAIYFPLSTIDDRVPFKWIAETVNDTHVFPQEIIKGFGAIDTGDFVTLYNYSTDVTRAFASPGITLTYNFDTKEITDTETGSVWSSEGYAISGDKTGTQLELIPTKSMFWMCASTHIPEIEMPKVDIEGNLE